ncbi:LuxR C-terminal-related transcriptional regulator [Streptomyces sp. NPDC092296]|uniref:LuxR C-terminal-related transcriptional regulator n=1 Tax=Streptomyces sp. NPDC092296 TaxID=3366012 RepID=UPI003821A433
MGMTATAARTRGEITAAARSAPDALAVFAAASHRLRRAVPFDAAVWRATDPITGLMTAPIRVENLSDEGCAVYWGCELLEGDVNLFHELARAPVPVAGLREATGDLPRRSSLYREFMQPRGLSDELRAVLRVGGRSWGQISLFRRTGAPAFDTRESGLVGSLTTPLAHRLRSFASPPVRPEPGAPYGPGLLLFDEHGTLLSANDEARRHLAELPDTPATGTALGLRVPVWVHSTALRARAVADGRAHGASRIRLRGRGGTWLVCHASCLRQADGSLGPSAVVIETASVSEVTPLIVEAYELSDRELEITELIARGLGTAEIADRLHISAHTVRDHIKAVFEKVRVGSRGELVARLFTEHYLPLGEHRVQRIWDGRA